MKNADGGERLSWLYPDVDRPRGMVLGVVLFSLLIAGVFLFAYHFRVRHQNLQAHREQIGHAVGMMAYSAAVLIADHLAEPSGETIAGLFPRLLTTPPPTGRQEEEVVADQAKAMELKEDVDRLLAQIAEDLPVPPRCRSVQVSILRRWPLFPSATPQVLQEGRDPVEQAGVLAVKCVVEVGDISRQASLQREFRVLGPLPGPMSRFTLFASQIPAHHSLNSMGVTFAGSVDPSYLHPFPPGNQVRGESPLKLFNGSGTNAEGGKGPTEAADILARRGWVFLGPAQDGFFVTLKIPAGYDPDTGGNFHFALPPDANKEGKSIVPLEELADPTHFPTTWKGLNLQILIQHVGFFVDARANQLWAGLQPSDPVWKCASTWLFPYGDHRNPSRTVVFGPVLAGYLKAYALSDPLPAQAWATLFPPDPYQDDLPLLASPKLTYGDFFLKKSESHRLVLPRNYAVDQPQVGKSEGVAFNLFFEFMDYSRTKSMGYPLPRVGVPSFAGNGDPYFGPSGSQTRYQDIPGLVSHERVEIRFKAGGTDPEDVYFKGDLARVSFDAQHPGNIPLRVSTVVDLSDCSTPEEEARTFHELVFADHPDKMRPRLGGMVYLIRRKGAGREPLALPAKPLELDRHLLLLVDRGDVVVPAAISGGGEGSEPDHLLTLAALEGNVRVTTDQPVAAYLVALHPSVDGAGGRLLGGGGCPSFHILGGAAVRSLGVFPGQALPTTQTEFPKGGTIEYNPRFNPGSPSYEESRAFLVSPEDRTLVLSGAGE